MRSHHLFLALAASLVACSMQATRTAPPHHAALRPAPHAAHAREPSPIAASASEAPAAETSVLCTCGTGAWLTYGRDAARTSASDGCVDGPLALTWSFSPAPFGGRSGVVYHAVADASAVYAVGLRGQSPVLHQVVGNGQAGWTFDSRADIHRSDWPTIVPPGAGTRGAAVVNDDGFYLIDLETGKHEGRGLDQWGPSLSDGGRIYLTNTLQIEGPGLFVAGYTADGKRLWREDKFFGAPQGFSDDTGGLCLISGTVIHAYNYRFGSHAAIAALDAETGARRWSISTMPSSAPAAEDGRVYLVERAKKDAEDRLVARSVEDGAVVWARPISGTAAVPPVVAAGRVIVHASGEVVAFDAATGERAWSAPIARRASSVGAATSLAAATGSGTLVVTSGDTLRVLSLDDGAERWSGAPRAGAALHSPVIVGRTVYVVADGALLRLDGAE